MSKQDDAIAAGHLTYNTGKPCRRGHDSDRYTSNGMCVACVKMKDDARRTARDLNRRKFIKARINNLHERVFMVHEDNRPIVEKFCELLQYGDGFEVAQVREVIERAYERAPTPKALAFDDLVKVMAWDGVKVTNRAQLEQIGVLQFDYVDSTLYFFHNQQRYRAEDAAEVLKGNKLYVKPILQNL